MSLAALLPAVLPEIQEIIGHIPDPAKQAELQAQAGSKLMELLAQQDAGQVELNKVEAASASLFVSGWRPFVGWCCGAALAFNYLLMALLTWALVMWSPDTPLPKLDISELATLLLAMLGFGGLRSFDKVKGVAR